MSRLFGHGYLYEDCPHCDAETTVEVWVMNGHETTTAAFISCLTCRNLYAYTFQPTQPANPRGTEPEGPTCQRPRDND